MVCHAIVKTLSVYDINISYQEGHIKVCSDSGVSVSIETTLFIVDKSHLFSVMDEIDAYKTQNSILYCDKSRNTQLKQLNLMTFFNQIFKY